MSTTFFAYECSPGSKKLHGSSRSANKRDGRVWYPPACVGEGFAPAWSVAVAPAKAWNPYLYISTVCRRVNVYMLKDIFATKALEMLLYSDADVITVAIVHQSSAGFNATISGIDSGNTLFTTTRKHSILLLNADLFAIATDFITLSFDIDHVDFDSVNGSVTNSSQCL